MFSIKQPKEIVFGKNSAHTYKYPKNPLIITSSGAEKRNWLEYLQLKNYSIFDKVEPNPSIDITTDIINEFHSTNFSNIIGIGGGSSIDFAKGLSVLYSNDKAAVAYRGFDKFKRPIKPIIAIPTTSGTGSEITPNASFINNIDKKNMAIRNFPKL